MKDPTSRLALNFAEYEYKICYKAGKINSNADALSKNPAVAPTVENIAAKIDSQKKSLFPLTQDKTPARSDLSLDTIPASTIHAKNNPS